MRLKPKRRFHSIILSPRFLSEKFNHSKHQPTPQRITIRTIVAQHVLPGSLQHVSCLIVLHEVRTWACLTPTLCLCSAIALLPRFSSSKDWSPSFTVITTPRVYSFQPHLISFLPLGGGRTRFIPHILNETKVQG